MIVSLLIIFFIFIKKFLKLGTYCRGMRYNYKVENFIKFELVRKINVRIFKIFFEISICIICINVTFVIVSFNNLY